MAILVTEGFENNEFGPPLAIIGDDNDGSQYQYTATSGTSLSGANTLNTVSIVSTTNKSGTYCLQSLADVGADPYRCGACGVHLVDSEYSKTFGAVVYVRFYVKWDSAHRFRQNGHKLYRHGPCYFVAHGCANANGLGAGTLQDASQYGDIGFYITGSTFTGGPSDANDFRFMSMSTIGQTDPDSWVVDCVRDAGKWWMFEIMEDHTNHRFSLWAMRPTDTAPSLLYENVSDAAITGGGSEVHLHWVNSGLNSTCGGTFWTDSIVIADSGPIGAHRWSHDILGKDAGVVKKFIGVSHNGMRRINGTDMRP